MASPINKLMGANLKHHASRYISTAIAITIAATFVVMTLTLSTGVLQQYMATINDSTQGSAAVVTWNLSENAEHSPTVQQQRQARDVAKKAIESVKGVKRVADSSYALSEPNPYTYTNSGYVFLEANDVQSMMSATYSQEAPLHVPVVLDGKLPTKNNEIALEKQTASMFEVKAGDKIRVGLPSADATMKEYTVSGIIAGSKFRSGTVVLSQESYSAIYGDSAAASYLVVPDDSSLYAPNSSEERQNALVNKITKALKSKDDIFAKAGLDYTVVSSQRIVTDGAKSAKTISTAMTGSTIIFPLIAAFVAAIIVGTTFQVIALQRRRELALLRAVGAQARQVRSLIFRETSIAGIISSFIGVTIGSLVGALLLMWLEVAPTYGVALTMLPWKWIGITWLISSLITIFVGLTPARKASAVSPLSALSPVESVQEKKRSHIVRIVIGFILLALSIAGIVYGLRIDISDTNTIYMRFAIVVFSTFVCWIAAMILFTVALPYIIYGFGSVVRTPVGRLARENVVRNPSRTASTGIAVIIGVVLMTTISVGVASVRSTITTSLNDTYPIDLTVSAMDGKFTDSQLKKLKSFKYADKSMEIPGAMAVSSPQDAESVTSVYGYSDISSVARVHIPVVEDGTIHVESSSSLAKNSTVNLCFLDSKFTEMELAEQPQELSAELAALQDSDCHTFTVVKDKNATTPVISDHDMKKYVPQAKTAEVVMRMKADANYEKVLSELGRMKNISPAGGFLIRGVFDQVLNIIVIVFLALLGVSVVISLVGVANTLGLSVVERTRENGLLRALGLSRAQMRRLLVWESFLTSFISTIVGMVMGTIFAIIGMHTLPFDGFETGVKIAFDWPQMIGLIAIIVLASVLAAWLPGRKASQVSPVEALAHD